MVLDAARGCIVLFGGMTIQVGGVSDKDTWELREV
jgi:hypothetical protein